MRTGRRNGEWHPRPSRPVLIWVTATIEKDGVAKAVEKWILDDRRKPEKGLKAIRAA